MSIASYVESLYRAHTEEFLTSPAFRRLAMGQASVEEFDIFIANVYRTHQNSPQFLAFIFSLASPSAYDRVAHNVLEEMGEEDDGESHPELLLALLEGAGMGARIDELQAAAREVMREVVCQPFMFGSLREVGLSAMAEVFSFEYMLAHSSRAIATALKEHRGLSDEALIWFSHHSEVDIQHAEEAMLTIQEYVDYYEFDDDEARDIIDLAMRENVFIKRYFSTAALAEARDMA